MALLETLEQEPAIRESGQLVELCGAAQFLLRLFQGGDDIEDRSIEKARPLSVVFMEDRLTLLRCGPQSCHPAQTIRYSIG